MKKRKKLDRGKDGQKNDRGKRRDGKNEEKSEKKRKT